MWKFLYALVFLLAGNVYGQQPTFESFTGAEVPRSDLRQSPDHFFAFETVLSNWTSYLNQGSGQKGISRLTIDLPGPDGLVHAFEIQPSGTMAPGLMAKYPEICSFTGREIANPRNQLRLDVNPSGIHAMVFAGPVSWALEPMQMGNNATHMAFYRSDLAPSETLLPCLTEEMDELPSTQRTTATNPTGAQLRLYRIAIGASGEYTTFHGGTKPLALAAMVVTMNRVNGIFERDFTVRFQLVANTDTMIYTDPNTDPYTNNNLGTMINENQVVCDSLIGNPNYDIGHVFGTAGGGLAGGRVCSDPFKARSGTGLNSPTGDFFDVDYLCHEIGHQLSAGHTFNDCGSQGPQPYEPGSGATIMAYLGLCGANNMDAPTLDQFLVASYDQVINWTQVGLGNTCPVVTATGNNPPEVVVPAGGFHIPFQTPFELIGSATDLDGDSLTYSWEQFDLGPSVRPDSAAGSAPLFRPWYANNSPTRVFPRLTDLVAGTTTIGELLPQFARPMTFRMVVRDNSIGGGGVDYEQINFDVAGNAGPFVVLNPNGGQVWTGGSVQNISWDVANTNVFPVSCAAVDIWLSEDGGFTYPYLLGSNYPNTGSGTITVPNLSGSNFRLKVKGAGNIFFDISDQDFSIQPVAQPDFTIAVMTPVLTLCGQDTGAYILDLDTLLNFTGTISMSLLGLPSGTVGSFSGNPANTPGTVTLMVSDTLGNAPGDFTVTLQATGSTGTKSLPLTLRLRPGVVPEPSLSLPSNGQTGVANGAVLSWNPVSYAQGYTLEVSESPSFVPLYASVNGFGTTTFTPPNGFQSNSIYYWRVKVDQTECGAGDWSPVYSFQTNLQACQVVTSGDTPIAISSSGTPTITSQIAMTQNFSLSSVKVRDLYGDHTWVDDLVFTLINPSGTRFELTGRNCGNVDDFDLEFDDAGIAGAIPCPPTTGLAYQPNDPLAPLIGSSVQGTWIMEIFDAVNQDGGNLKNWALEFCNQGFNPSVPVLTVQGLTVQQGGNGSIDNSLLNGACSSITSGLIYVITSLPQNGDLLVNGVLVAVGDSISQNIIDGGGLVYVHDNSATVTDQFGYVAICTNGGYIGGLTFNISVQLSVGFAAEAGNEMQVFPNPARDRIKVRIAGEFQTGQHVQLVNMVGQVVRTLPLSGNEVELEVSDLPGGMYLLEWTGEGRQLGVERVVLLR